MQLKMMPSKLSVVLRMVAVCVVGVACSGTGTGPVALFDLSGAWTVNAATSNAQVGHDCTSTQSVSLAQSSDGRLTGTADGDNLCTTVAGFARDVGVRDVVEASITGDAVVFQISRCKYEGTAESSTSMRGTVSCSWPHFGNGIFTTGSWQAGR